MQLNQSNFFKEIKKLNYFEKNSIVAVAVSGGIDSISLVFLLSKWFKLKKIKIIALIVDHKLRKNSTQETLELKYLLKKFDIDCKILVWEGKKPKSNIQSVARKNRYSLIINQILKDKFNHLLIAHHLDDLYENFFIRLLRGSGLKGLTSFNQVNSRYNNKIKILRPLIKVNKNDLLFIAMKIFNYYIKDPSNENINFKRVRIRNLINSLKNEGLDEKTFTEYYKNADRTEKLWILKNADKIPQIQIDTGDN